MTKEKYSYFAQFSLINTKSVAATFNSVACAIWWISMLFWCASKFYYMQGRKHMDYLYHITWCMKLKKVPKVLSLSFLMKLFFNIAFQLPKVWHIYLSLNLSLYLPPSFSYIFISKISWRTEKCLCLST